jgi:hypothetical protein
VRFENFRINGDRGNGNPLIQLKPVVNGYMSLKVPGKIDGIYFKNIVATAFPGPKGSTCPIVVLGDTADHQVKNVTFENIIRVDGSVVMRTSPSVMINQYTSNIIFLSTTIAHPADFQARSARYFGDFANMNTYNALGQKVRSISQGTTRQAAGIYMLFPQQGAQRGRKIIARNNYR